MILSHFVSVPIFLLSLSSRSSWPDDARMVGGGWARWVQRLLATSLFRHNDGARASWSISTYIRKRRTHTHTHIVFQIYTDSTAHTCVTKCAHTTEKEKAVALSLVQPTSALLNNNHYNRKRNATRLGKGRAGLVPWTPLPELCSLLFRVPLPRSCTAPVSLRRATQPPPSRSPHLPCPR